jgi:hypothetical protein
MVRPSIPVAGGSEPMCVGAVPAAIRRIRRSSEGGCEYRRGLGSGPAIRPWLDRAEGRETSGVSCDRLSELSSRSDDRLQGRLASLFVRYVLEPDTPRRYPLAHPPTGRARHLARCSVERLTRRMGGLAGRVWGAR